MYLCAWELCESWGCRMCLSVSLNQISSLNPLLFFFVLSLGAWAMVGLKLKCSLQGPFGPCGTEIRFEDRAFSLRKDPLGPRSRSPFRFRKHKITRNICISPIGCSLYFKYFAKYYNTFFSNFIF